ncbi:DUF3823 domain-containing protein [Mucilaginibacter sp. SMC90]|uniref:DUF3823 domain-containing protein n=1 Tax=Mucilaginibacter sp. SMC90 TaxID=2929803 RepID=UPI001FB2B730|nr:DUF3823 domain-containing protein [Mucilaginibacter sp. SMC90]UOE47425.1 DUF3823 domain-containing protein [Mucilaginibacter sp. SMC90]
MKLKNIVICSFIGLGFAISSCKQDNYPVPNAGIQGAITDAATGSQIQTEQPNGIKIRLIETKYGNNVTPNDFWCRANGSFENTQVFAGRYKVVPIEGAFFPADTAIVDVSGLTTVNFKVTPYLTITANVTAVAGGVNTSYTISRTKAGDKITTARTLVSAYPTVSNTINEFSTSNDLSGIEDNVILGKQYADAITGLTSGKTYYVRVAARTANANNKFNYSEAVKIIVP